MYGEIVIFENGVRGMVQDIKRDQIGCIILGKDTGIKEGTKVTRTKKKAGVPVGNAYLDVYKRQRKTVLHGNIGQCHKNPPCLIRKLLAANNNVKKF